MSKLKSKFALAILLGAGVLCAVPAFAVDGQILINQSSVMALGGFPFKITQPGSYKLSGNLVVPGNTDGIDITADNVALDLNGFNISGPLKCTFAVTEVSCSGSITGYGVFSQQTNTTVKNGSITGMASAGVSANGALIEELSVAHNTIGISASGIVRRCVASLNRIFGIELVLGVVQDSFMFENGTGLFASVATVTGNHISSSATLGMGVEFTTFGSNSFFGNNSGNIGSGNGTTSQNNNNCDGATC
jgi:hypothetical protein